MNVIVFVVMRRCRRGVTSVGRTAIVVVIVVRRRARLTRRGVVSDVCSSGASGGARALLLTLVVQLHRLLIAHLVSFGQLTQFLREQSINHQHSHLLVATSDTHSLQFMIAMPPQHSKVAQHLILQLTLAQISMLRRQLIVQLLLIQRAKHRERIASWRRCEFVSLGLLSFAATGFSVVVVVIVVVVVVVVIVGLWRCRMLLFVLGGNCFILCKQSFRFVFVRLSNYAREFQVNSRQFKATEQNKKPPQHMLNKERFSGPLAHHNADRFSQTPAIASHLFQTGRQRLPLLAELLHCQFGRHLFASVCGPHQEAG
jgi:hypothetical protein